MMDIFDQRIDEGRARFRIAQAKRNALALDATAPPAVTAGFSASMASEVAQLQRVIDECKVQFPESAQPAKPAPKVEDKDRAPGELLREATEVAEAIRKLAKGEAGQAMSPVVEQPHRLPVYRVEGGSR